MKQLEKYALDWSVGEKLYKIEYSRLQLTNCLRYSHKSQVTRYNGTWAPVEMIHKVFKQLQLNLDGATGITYLIHKYY